MATVPVASVLSRVAVLLQDPTNIRWPQSELVDWLNDGQREVVLLKPNAFVKNVSVQLAAGTKQALPADGLSLVDMPRNMGTDGNTPGVVVRATSREILDAVIPTWHSTAASATAKHFCYTPLDPKTFYVFPPQPASARGYVEIIYAAAPADASLGGTITLDDIYVTALVAYILYRAYSKDAEFAANAQLATAYYAQFTALLQGKATAEAATNPMQALAPMNPNLPGADK